MSLIEEMNALLESANKNEGLPPELDKALRELPAKKRKDFGSRLYNLTTVDLNGLKANQIKSTREKGKGYWTVLFDMVNKDWYLYDPQGNLKAASGRDNGKSFTATLSQGKAFNIDTKDAALQVDKRQQRRDAKAGSDIDWNSPLFRDKHGAGTLGWNDLPIDKSGYSSRIRDLLKKVSLKSMQKDIGYFIELVGKFEDDMDKTYKTLRTYAAKQGDAQMLDRVITWARPEQIGEYLKKFVAMKRYISDEYIKKDYKEYQDKFKQDPSKYNHDTELSYEEYKAKILKHAASDFASTNIDMQARVQRYKDNIKQCLKEYPELIKLVK